jgi:hypothetical protein
MEMHRECGCVGFKVSTAVNMNSTLSWVVTPCISEEYIASIFVAEKPNLPPASANCFPDFLSDIKDGDYISLSNAVASLQRIFSFK